MEDSEILALKRKLHEQEVVINTLRGMLFTAWRLTNSYEKDDDQL